MLFALRFDFSVGSQVLIRCDLNVPLDGKKITDDTRIRASVETIKYLVGKGARVAVSRPHFPRKVLARTNVDYTPQQMTQYNYCVPRTLRW